MEIEPNLDPLSGEELDYKSANRRPDARSDVRVRGFWGNRQDAFFEFRVFNPFASSYASKSVDAMFSSVSQKRKRKYGDRIIRVDNGSFTPMVLASTGGTGNADGTRRGFSTERQWDNDGESPRRVVHHNDQKKRAYGQVFGITIRLP